MVKFNIDTTKYGEVTIELTGKSADLPFKVGFRVEDIAKKLYSDGNGHFWVIYDGYWREVAEYRLGWNFVPRGSDELVRSSQAVFCD